MVQLRILLLSTAVSVSVYKADCIEHKVQVWIVGILMQCKCDLVLLADPSADFHTDTIKNAGVSAFQRVKDTIKWCNLILEFLWNVLETMTILSAIQFGSIPTPPIIPLFALSALVIYAMRFGIARSS